MTDALQRLAERLPEVAHVLHKMNSTAIYADLEVDAALTACAAEVERLESAEVELAVTLRETIRATTIHRKRAEKAEAALIYDDAGDHVQTWESRAIVLEQRAEQVEAEVGRKDRYCEHLQELVTRAEQKYDGACAMMAITAHVGHEAWEEAVMNAREEASHD
jgi:hypothetical protein